MNKDSASALNAHELNVAVSDPISTLERPTCCLFEDNIKCDEMGSPACVCCFHTRRGCLLGCLLPSLILIAVLAFFLFPRCILVEPHQETFQLSSLAFSTNVLNPSLTVAVYAITTWLTEQRVR